jgi:hypothetical protein
MPSAPFNAPRRDLAEVGALGVDVARRAIGADGVREGERRGVAELRCRGPAPKPHWMPSSLAKSLVVRTMPRFDFDLRLRRVELDEQRRRPIDAGLQVGDDQVVGARVHLNLTSAWSAPCGRRSGARSAGLGVGQRLGDRHQLTGERLFVGQLAARLAFLLQRVDRRDPDDRALDRVVELIGRAG